MISSEASFEVEPEPTLGSLITAQLGVAGAEAAMMLQARVTSSRPGWYLERAVPCTPYALETLGDDALQAGPGAHLEVTVPRSARRDAFDWVEQRLAVLARKGIRVSVRIEPPAPFQRRTAGASGVSGVNLDPRRVSA